MTIASVSRLPYLRGVCTSQLSALCSYTVLENRTAVDLELTAMRKENVLRAFRLGTGRGEDWGIMSTEHYLRVVSAPRSWCHRVPVAVVSSESPASGSVWS